MKHGARGKKQTLKSASTDLGTTDVGESGGVFARRPRGPRCRVTTNKYLQCFQMPVMNIQMHLKSTSAGHEGAIFSFLIVAGQRKMQLEVGHYETGRQNKQNKPCVW